MDFFISSYLEFMIKKSTDNIEKILNDDKYRNEMINNLKNTRAILDSDNKTPISSVVVRLCCHLSFPRKRESKDFI